MKGLFAKTKRKIAALLVTVMTLQAILPAGAPGLLQAFAAGGDSGLTYDVIQEGKVNPAEAFRRLSLEIHPKITQNGEIHISLEGELCDGNGEWTQQQYEAFLDNYDGLDEEDFEAGWPESEEEEIPAKEKYDSYKDYLNQRPDSQLAPMSFSISFDKELLDESLAGYGDYLYNGTGSGETIGTWEIRRDAQGNYELAVELDKFLYYRQDTVLGMSANLALSQWYEPGTGIEKGTSVNGADIGLKIEGGADASPSDADYSLIKSVEVDGHPLSDPNGTIDGREFSYILLATTSNALPVSYMLPAASDSNWTTATGSNAAYKIGSINDLILDEDVLAHYRTASGSDADWEDDYESEEERGFWSEVYRRVLGGAGEGGDEIPDLAGKWIIDTLPSGLELAGVSVRVAGEGSWEPLADGVDGYTYDEETRVLKYQMGTGLAAMAGLDALELKLDVRLSEELFREHMTGSGTKSYSFPNRAFIRSDEEEKNLAVSNRVNPKVELSEAITKDGETVDGSNGTFKWTLTVNSQFYNDGVRLWVIDHIEDVGNSHEFIVEDGVTFAPGEKKIGITELTGGGFTHKSYDDIKTVSDIEEILEGHDADQPGGPDTAFMYEYDSGVNNGQQTTDAIVLIPLHTEYLDQVTEITYETKISEKLLMDPDSYGTDLNFKNEARLAWRWPGGPGVGIEEGSASIGKSVGTRFHLLKKEAGEHKYDTGIQPWAFKINEDGLEIGEAVFYDDFKDSEQQLVLPEDGRIPLTKINRANHSSELIDVSGGSRGEVPYYVYEGHEVDGEPGHRFSLYLGDLGADAGYEFQLNTRILNSSIPGEESHITIVNVAHLTGIVGGGQEIDVPAMAETTIDNTLIVKTAEPVAEGGDDYFDYRDNTVRWKVEVNPRKWEIDGARVTDTLPAGMEFKELISVVEKGADGSTDEYTITQPVPDAADGKWSAVNGAQNHRITLTETPPADSDGQQSFDADLGDIQSTFVLEFKTVLTEEFQKELKSGVTYPFKNTAELTGRHNESPIVTSDTAKADVAVNPMTKSGKYEKRDYTYQNCDGEKMELHDVPVLSWELLVNRTRMDIAGTTITDMMEDAETGDCFMELVPGSIKVYEVELDPVGNVVTDLETALPVAAVIYDETAKKFVFKENGQGSSFDIDETKTNCSTDGFMYTVPVSPEYKSTLMFVFDTLLSDDVTAGEMKNSAQISGKGIDDSVTSPSAGGARDFFVENYSKTSGVYFIKLHKVSANEDKKFPLKGARFKIQAMKLSAGGSAENLEDWEIDAEKSEKIKTSNRRGNLTFLFLEQNTLYRITEITAPDGYEVEKNTWYFVPSLKDKTKEDFPLELLEVNADTLDPNDEDNNNTYILDIQDESDGNYMKTDIANGLEPSSDGMGGSIFFEKRGHGDQLLPGVWFQIKHNRGYIETQYAKSDEKGIVKFDNLDPLKGNEYYIIEEAESNPPGDNPDDTADPMPPKGYKQWTGSVKVNVTYENQHYVVTHKSDSDGYKTRNDDTNPVKFTITNTPVTQAVSFKKVDQDGEILPGTEFKVERRGHGGEAISGSDTYPAITGGQLILDVDGDGRIAPDDKEAYVPYLVKQTVTAGSDGVVRFENAEKLPYGDYLLTETKVPDGVDIKGENLLEIRVSVTEKGVDLSYKKKKESDAARAWKPLNNGGTVENELEHGLIHIKKVAANYNADGNLMPTDHMLEATFNIYLDKDENETLETNSDVLVIEGIKTNADTGTFDWSSDDNKEFANKLVLGKQYLLVETAVSDDRFKVDETVYPFTLTKDNTEAYIGSIEDVIEPGKLGQTDASAAVFPNAPKYAGISLSKVSAGNASFAVAGAEFDVYAKDRSPEVKVARITYVQGTTPDEAGQYVLKPGDGSAGYIETAANGCKYLYEKDGVFQLLAGDYRIKETKVPAGYEEENRSDLVITVGNQPVKEKIKNTLKTGAIRIQKQIRDADGLRSPVQKDGEFQFILTGTPDDDRIWTEKHYQTQTDGKCTISDIPLGKYIIREDKDHNVSPAYVCETDAPIYAKVWYDSEDKQVKTTYYSDRNYSTELPAGKLSEDGIPVVINRIVYGSLEATKYLNYDLTKVNTNTKDAAYSGVTFTLTPTANNTNIQAKPLKSNPLEATSGAEGKISFKDVPVGEYTLKETAVPEGYKAAQSITVVIEDGKTTTAGSDNQGLEIVNHLLQTTASFIKIDQNEKLLGGITFTINRQGDGGTEKGAGTGKYQFDFNSTDKEYHSYSPMPSAETDDTTAVLNLKNLVVGEYRLDEVNANVEKPVSIYLTVSATGAGADGDAVLTAEFKDKDGNPVLDDNNRFQNTLKHGNLEINKVVGSWNDDGKPIDTNGKPLEGAQFKIYRDNGDKIFSAEEDAEILSKTTNAKGNLALTEEEQVLLIAGQTYFLRETSSNGYDIQGSAYMFIPEEPENGKTKTTYIGVDKHKPGESNIGYGANPDLVFPNARSHYGEVELTKTAEGTMADGTNKKLSGAEFTVYVADGENKDKNKNKKVARLTESETNTGIYTLAKIENPSADNTYAGQDEYGSNYLRVQKKDGETSYLLLPGDYYIKETKAPNGYELPEDIEENWKPITVKAEADNKVTVDFSDAMRQGTVRLEKQVEILTEKGVFRDVEPDEEFIFELFTDADAPGPIDGTSFKTRRIETDGSTSKAVFENVPMGTYRIREVLTEEQELLYHSPAGIKVTLSYDEEKQKVVAAYDEGNPATDTDAYAKVYNLRRRGSVEAAKTADYQVGDEAGRRNLPLAGAEFSLTDISNSTVQFHTSSNADGTVLFEDIPVGTYILKEEKAPTGYEKSDTTFTVEVKLDGETVKTDNAGAPLNISNTLVKQSAAFRKIDQNEIPVPGVIFQIFRRGDGGTLSEADGNNYLFDFDTEDTAWKEYQPQPETPVTGADGIVRLENLVYGEYELREVFADAVDNGNRIIQVTVNADGITMRDETGTVIADGSDVTNILKTGRVNIRKVAANWNDDGSLTTPGTVHPIAGAEFAIYRESGRQPGFDGVNSMDGADGGDPLVVGDLFTGKDGTFATSSSLLTSLLGQTGLEKQEGRLIAGRTYYLVEVKAADGYTPNGTAFAFVPEADKVLWVGSSGTEVLLEHAGKATSSDADELVFVNGPEYYGRVSFTKTSERTHEKLHGAGFDVYTAKGGEEVRVARLLEDGDTGTYVLEKGSNYIILDRYDQSYIRKGADGYELLAGTYWIKETKAPDGYELPGEQDYWYFEIDRENYRAPLTTVYDSADCATEKAFTNDIQKAGLTVEKLVEQEFTDGAYIGIRNVDGDFVFELSGKPADGTAFEPVRATASNAAGGVAVFHDVPLGTYTVTEILTAGQQAIYQAAQQVDVKIDYNSKNETTVTYTYDGRDSTYGEDEADNRQLVRNTLQKGGFEAWKYTVDRTASPGNATERSLEGAAFRLTSADGAVFACDQVLMSGPDGKIHADNLPVGTYTLKELEPPTGYLLGAVSEWTVVVVDKKVTGTELQNPLKLENVPVKGFVRLTKVDEEDRSESLDGVTFTLYAKDGTEICDLVSEIRGSRYVYGLPDPKAAAAQNPEIWKYMTYFDETAETGPALYYGEYYVEETGTIPGYIRDTGHYEVRIEQDGETVVVKNTDDGSGLFTNEKGKGSISIEKLAEVIETGTDGVMRPGEGFTFYIRGSSVAGEKIEDYLTEEDITGASAVAIRTDGADGGIYVTTGSSGTVVLEGVRAGVYDVAETENEKNGADGAYIRDTQVRTARIEIEESAGEQLLDEEKISHVEFTVENHLKRGTISGTKTRSNGAPLAEAVIGLFPAGTSEYTEENLYQGMKAVSGSDGIFRFEHVPCGTYLIAELQAPSGYVLNRRTVFEVSIVSDGQTVTAGYLAEPGKDKAGEQTEIVIANSRKSGGGDGGGGGSTHPGPTGPADPTNPGPGVPTEPVTPTGPAAPTAPTEPTAPTAPADGQITIPFDPDNPVINIPGNPPRVEIVDQNEDTVYDGPGTNIDIGGWEPGDYTVYTFDDQDVPLGTMILTIDEEGVPLAYFLPKTGDQSLPYALLAAIMLGALGGMAALYRRRRKERR